MTKSVAALQLVFLFAVVFRVTEDESKREIPATSPIDSVREHKRQRISSIVSYISRVASIGEKQKSRQSLTVRHVFFTKLFLEPRCESDMDEIGLESDESLKSKS